MNRTLSHLLLVLPLMSMPACEVQDHSHGPGGHTHGEQAADRPAVAVTHWTDRTELFMEYPVFVAGKSGRSAIHVTDLADFSPVDEGEAVVALRSEDGRVLRFRGGPTRPGIFGIDLEADRPGTYDMTLHIETPGFEDLHELGRVTVHRPGEPLPAAAEEEESISFLKEQQWTLDFGTARVEARALRPSVSVPAVVRPRAGGEAILAAPVPGRIDSGSDVPVPGARVRAGSILASIVPRSDDLRDAATLRAALVEAEQDHGLAVRELDRVERLVEGRALPSRRRDEARAAETSSEARLEAARARLRRYEALSQSGDESSGRGSFAVRAPFDGVVSEVGFAPGASVEENDVLLRVVDTDRVHLVGAVPESGVGDLQSVEGGELLLEDASPMALSAPITVGRVIEPIARTTEIRFAFDNEAARLPIGKSVRLRVFFGGEAAAPAIPDSAIVEDAGRPVAFVQTAGESFERRPVRLGSRAGGWVHVLEGVEPGERVVHRGAYLVRLAAMSTQIPAHGHVH